MICISNKRVGILISEIDARSYKETPENGFYPIENEMYDIHGPVSIPNWQRREAKERHDFEQRLLIKYHGKNSYRNAE